MFIYTAIHGEPLPKLLLQFQKRPYHALKENEAEKAREHRKQLARRSHRRTNVPPSQVELNTDEGIRAAFYDPTDAAGFSSFANTPGKSTCFIPNGCTFSRRTAICKAWTSRPISLLT